ncbi:MAG: DUF4435 domain-containing protein [Alistipes sp.]|jgi:hypothetical protein|nr:DUF4435 domain-containing protein [Alistipes sp.]
MTKRTRNSEEIFIPSRLSPKKGQRLVEVYVEGYDDVAFWRDIFDEFESPRVTFEISVPPRPDLAKGKRVVMEMIPRCGPQRLLCVDSDFDYIFDGGTAQSRQVLSAPYLFHTYTYSAENYLCWAPALHTVCTKATKNDTRIFDFERFMEEYSRIIHPVFVWYAWSARSGDVNVFKLIDFKNTVRLNYLELRDNGADTLDWLRGNVERRVASLTHHHPDHAEQIGGFASRLEARGVTPENTYLFMHGHTLLDNVVMPMLSTVCENLKRMSGRRIENSAQRGTAFANEVSNYRNALVNVRDTLVYNEMFKESPLYKRLHDDIAAALRRSGLL